MKKTEQRPRRVAGKSAHAAVDETTSTNTETSHGEQLNLSEIKELIELVSEKEFNEFELQRGRFRLRLQKGLSRAAVEIAHSSSISSSASTNPLDQIRIEHPAVAAPAPAAPVEEKLHLITSPIVGTFYRSPSPAAEPFIKIGDLIETGKTLCIIEAMKLMNEIQSDVSGSVAKIFVENGQPVEYGQPLFGIRV